MIQTLVNPDLCPKNVFVYPGSAVPGVFDFEFCSGVGDPIYDLGFLAGHLIITSALKEYPLSFPTAACITSYDTVYPLHDRLPDIAWYAACTVLYRRFGASKWPGLEALPPHHSLFQRAKSIILKKGGQIHELIDHKS